MAVHLPLSDKAQAEAREIMAANRNLLKPADGHQFCILNKILYLVVTT